MREPAATTRPGRAKVLKTSYFTIVAFAGKTTAGAVVGRTSVWPGVGCAFMLFIKTTRKAAAREQRKTP
jgi:hypothetical protein